MSYILGGKFADARRELDWIKDHSAPNARKDGMISRLHRDLDVMTGNLNAYEIDVRIEELRKAAVKAGPTDADKAILRY